MPKLTRKNLRSEVSKLGLTEDKASELVDNVMQMFGTSTNDLFTQEDVQQQIKEALEKAPNIKDFKETEDYKNMLNTINEYKHKDDIRTLTDKGVKTEKYAEFILTQLDKEKDIDEQLTTLKEDYSDMFNVEHEDSQEPTQPNVPQFGAQTKGSAPKGNEVKSFIDYWGIGNKQN